MINLESLTLTRLNQNYEINFFDCGDDNLNEFLFNDAKNYLAELMAITYVYEYNNQIAAYFCLLTDKVVFDTSHAPIQLVNANIQELHN